MAHIPRQVAWRVIYYNALKMDSAVFPYLLTEKTQPAKTLPTKVDNNVVTGIIGVVVNLWSLDPHANRPVVQFADNRVVRGWTAIAQSTLGAFWTSATLRSQAAQALVLTLSGNVFDYWARITGHDLVVTGNHSQSAIQYRVGRTFQQSANIPAPVNF